MLAGYEYVCDLQMLWEYHLEVYEELQDQAVDAVVKLYTGMLEYHAQVVCFLHSGGLRRQLEGTTKKQDWTRLREGIAKAHQLCRRYLEPSDTKKAMERYEAERQIMLDMVVYQSQILDAINPYAAT